MSSQYTLTVMKKCKETSDPPNECWTTINFSQKGYPELKVSGDAYSFAAADINQDGVDEIIVLSAEGGNWSQVYIFAIADPTKTSGPIWYKPTESFMWFPGFEGATQ